MSEADAMPNKKLDCTWPEARLAPRRTRVADEALARVLAGRGVPGL